jgi:hypothetical protein
VTFGLCPRSVDPNPDSGCSFYHLRWRNVARNATGIHVYRAGFWEGPSGGGCDTSRTLEATLRPTATSYSYATEANGECVYVASFNSVGSSALVRVLP